LDRIISIEDLLQALQPTIIVILLIVLLRFILSRVLSSLTERGSITVTTRATIMKAVDVVVFFTVIIALLQSVAAPYEVLIAIVLIIVIGLFIFYYELREFLAYINLQLLRHLRGRTFEIYFPYHSKPVYGRIVNIELLSATIEDIYGRKIYVSNSLLMNAVLKDHIPSITLKITLKNIGENPTALLNNVIGVIRDIESKIFRVDERRISIENMGLNSVVFKLTVYPFTTPIRISDLANFIGTLNSLLNKYEPVIEIIEPG